MITLLAWENPLVSLEIMDHAALLIIKGVESNNFPILCFVLVKRMKYFICNCKEKYFEFYCALAMWKRQMDEMETVKQDRFSIGFKCDTAVPAGLLGMKPTFSNKNLKNQPLLHKKLVQYCCINSNTKPCVSTNTIVF